MGAKLDAASRANWLPSRARARIARTTVSGLMSASRGRAGEVTAHSDNAVLTASSLEPHSVSS